MSRDVTRTTTGKLSRQALPKAAALHPSSVVRGPGRRGRRPLRHYRAWPILAVCWFFALALHLAWLPNLSWFFADYPPPVESAVVEVVSLAVDHRGSDRGESQGPPLERAYRAQREMQPGASDGAASAQQVMNQTAHSSVATDRQQSWAVRALHHEAEPRPWRVPRPEPDQTSPAPSAWPTPGQASLLLEGRRQQRDATLSRPQEGDQRQGQAGLDEGEGSRDERAGLPRDEQGRERPASRQQRMAGGAVGGPSRQAAPLVPAAEAGTNGPTGLLSGREQSPQVAPARALSDPVREVRRATTEDGDSLHGGTLARNGTSGSGRARWGNGRAGPGRSRSGSGQASGRLLADYLRDAMAQIGRHWRYPDGLAYSLDQGLVVVQIRVRHDGRVEAVDVQRSSGRQEFDQGALQAVERASPLPPPPPEMLFRHRRNFLVLSLPMRYRNPMFE
jgi:protein TonB